MQEMCCAIVGSQEATIWFLWRGQVAFPKKQNEKKNSGGSIIFLFRKNIQDRLNITVRFVLSLGNMSKVLNGNKKTGLCREKKYPGQKHLPVPHKYQMVAPLAWLGR